ncbi:MAG: hypothetical protein K6C94_01955 [Candidatus Gastranaerophilales bacterium]|nr:hypothetical protein [Candidatus Gastranaerophilales bacterium]
MKKLLLLGILCLSSNIAAFGYDIYYVPATKPYTYQFNVFAPEKMTNAQEIILFLKMNLMQFFRPEYFGRTY